MSSELSLAPGSEQNQDSMDIGPQAVPTVDENGEHCKINTESLEECTTCVKTTSKELRKTWGFRRTTIAKRETPTDVDQQNSKSAPVRRTGCNTSDTGKLEEFLSTTKRRRGGRRSTPACLESSKPQSQMPSDADTTSEASFHGYRDTKAVEVSAGMGPTTERKTCRMEMPQSGNVSDDENDSDELTLKELQKQLKEKKTRLMGPDGESHTAQKADKERSHDKPAEAKASGRRPAMRTRKSSASTRVDGYLYTESEEEETSEVSSGRSGSKSYNPNALYCICQQKHNNRFMICCDCCEEWFHGDCVGISEALGRLLEGNGEDYICPKCTMQKSHQSTPSKQATPIPEEIPLISLTVPSTGVEDKSSQEEGIKGRIEKAAKPSGKKKLKIFQLVSETSALPKCIGPGCDKIALPDSVYCGNDCILKHAAATMKFLTNMKEPLYKQKPKAQGQKECTGKPPSKGQKRSLPENRTEKKEDSDDQVEAVVDQETDTLSWSSDHNYNAVKKDNTTAIPSSVFYKSSGKESEEMSRKNEPAPSEKLPPFVSTPLKGRKKRSIPGGIPTKSSTSANCDRAAKKPNHLSKYSVCKKSSPAPVLLPVSQSPSRHHVLGALKMSKTTHTIPKKMSEQKQPPAPPIFGPSSLATEPVSLAPTSTSRPPQPQPNEQIRHNIRRSLTEIMFKRVSDSDDLEISEREVGKLAVTIEKEMYNLFLNTGSKYKNKYRSIMFNLKDPKNKGLFYRVIRGEVSPFKLVRLSPEELLSKYISEWRHRETAEDLQPSLKSQSGEPKLDLTQQATPDFDMEKPPPFCDGDGQDEPSPTAFTPSQSNVVSPVPDVFCGMLEDTTAEHRAHLFHLNCKICTGQMLAHEEPVPKKPKLCVSSAPNKAELKDKQVPHISKAGGSLDNGDSCPPLDSETISTECPASPDDTSRAMSLSQSFTPITLPSVSIIGQDPRTASYRPTVAITSAVHTVSSTTESVPDIKTVLPSPPPSSIPKSILVNPASSQHMRFFSTSGSSSSLIDCLSHSPLHEETTLFLSKQEILWKGFINMYTVATFITKAYWVSGSFKYLKEDLPDTIHIGGRISPNTVWDYVEKLKTSLSKELCLSRFHPATEEEEVAYISLFSYFNSRGRFGVVSNNSHHIKDLYLIPLSAKDPIPSQLIPFEGPGLEPTHCNLLLGLVICQKQKCSGSLQEGEDGTLPIPLALSRNYSKQDNGQLYSPEMPVNITPSGSPQSISSSESSTSLSAPLGLSLLTCVTASAPVTTSLGKNSPSCMPTTPPPTPLQTILKTLFGKKPNSAASMSSSGQNLLERVVPPDPLLNPTVQQLGQISKEEVIEEDEADRPYDPEEEYGSGMGYEMKTSLNAPKVSEAGQPPTVDDDDDVVYDPEDETIFEEMTGAISAIPGHIKAKTSHRTENPFESDSSNLTEQQKMLKELNEQIEEQKQQLAEQEESLRQQRAAVGVSLAHFSVSDALMSPPSESLLTHSQLLLADKKVEEVVAETPATQVINHKRDPRQSRDLRQEIANQRLNSDSVEKEEIVAGGCVEDTSLQLKCSQSDTSQPVVTQNEPASFLHTMNLDVSIPLLGEKIDHEMQGDTPQGSTPTQLVNNSYEAEIEGNPYTSWPYSAIILEGKKLSSLELNKSEQCHESSVSNPAISYDVTFTNTSMADSQAHVKPALGMQSPSFVGSEEMPPPILFQSQHESPQLQGSPFLHMENDQVQYRDASQFKPLGHCLPHHNQWSGAQQCDNFRGCLHTAAMVQRGPHPCQPMDQRGSPPHHDVLISSLPLQSTGQKGPSLGQFMDGDGPPLHFSGQNDLHQQKAFPPSFNCSRPGAPPPRFIVPHSRHFNNRGPLPTQCSGPREHLPLFSSRGPNKQQYNQDSYQQHMEQNQEQTAPHMYRKDQIPSQAHYMGPPHYQFEGQRGQGNEMGAQRFTPPTHFWGPRASSSHFHSQRLPLAQHRASHLSKFQGQRGLSPVQFGVPGDHKPSQFLGSGRQPQFHNEGLHHKSDGRPLRHSSPLLPTPPEGPIQIPNYRGHSQDHWWHSPDIRRRNSTRDDSEPQNNGNRLSMFEGSSHGRVNIQGLHFSEERQRALSEEKRIKRGDEDSRMSNWNPSQPWSREQQCKRNSERERGHSRGREMERHSERDGDKKRDRDCDRNRGRDRDWNTRDFDRNRARNRDRRCDWSRSRDHGRDNGRRHRGRDLERRERSKSIEKGKEVKAEATKERETCTNRHLI